MDIHNWIIDIQKSFMDINNSIMDIHNSIYGYPKFDISIITIYYFMEIHKLTNYGYP